MRGFSSRVWLAWHWSGETNLGWDTLKELWIISYDAKEDSSHVDRVRATPQLPISADSHESERRAQTVGFIDGGKVLRLTDCIRSLKQHFVWSARQPQIPITPEERSPADRRRLRLLCSRAWKCNKWVMSSVRRNRQSPQRPICPSNIIIASVTGEISTTVSKNFKNVRPCCTTPRLLVAVREMRFVLNGNNG